jgi:hypothetical protein
MPYHRPKMLVSYAMSNISRKLISLHSFMPMYRVELLVLTKMLAVRALRGDLGRVA